MMVASPGWSALTVLFFSDDASSPVQYETTTSALHAGAAAWPTFCTVNLTAYVWLVLPRVMEPVIDCPSISNEIWVTVRSGFFDLAVVGRPSGRFGPASMK